MCSYCKKSYSSYQSRCNHIRKYHKPTKSPKNNPVYNPPIIIEEDNDYKCRKCDKSFGFIQNRWRHEKICKVIKVNEIELMKAKFQAEKEKDEKEKAEINEKLEKDKAEMKAEMEKLRKLIDKANKKIINKTNNINHGIINNIQINAVGSENIIKKLTNKEKIDLITSPMFKEKPVVNLVKKVYNEEKFEEDRNTILNNLRSKSCLTFNDDTRQFDAINKNNHLDNIINCRKDDIKKLFDQMETKLKPLHKKIYEEYMENIDNEETMKIHKEEIMYILYNCKTFMNDLKNKLEELIEEVSDEKNIEL